MSVRLRSLNFTLSNDGWNNDSESLPRLEMRVTSTSDGLDIASIQYVFQTETGSANEYIDEDPIRSISTQLKVPESEWEIPSSEFSGSEVTDPTLIHQMESILDVMSEDEIVSTAAPYPLILADGRLLPPVPPINYRQRLVDVYVAETTFFLSVMSLLYGDQMRGVLPFSFDLPFSRFDGRVLSENFIQYMLIPLDSVRITGNRFSREMSWLIRSFYNSWGSIFEKGTLIVTEPLYHSVINNVVSITVSRLDEATDRFSTMVTESVEKTIRDIRPDYDLLTNNVSHLKKISDSNAENFQQSIRNINDRMDRLERMLGHLSVSVDSLVVLFNHVSETVRQHGTRLDPSSVPPPVETETVPTEDQAEVETITEEAPSEPDVVVDIPEGLPVPSDETSTEDPSESPIVPMGAKPPLLRLRGDQKKKSRDK